MAASAQPAPADLDLSFGVKGSAVVEDSAGASAFHTQAPPRMALGPKGEIFVLHANAAPCAEFSNCPIQWAVSRYSFDGVRDTGFGTAVGSILEVHGNEYEPAAFAVGTDGRPVVAALDEGRVVVWRFDSTGHLEAQLGAADAEPLLGGAYTPPVIAVQPDGKVLVAVGSAFELRVVRYLADGERDPAFGTAGETTVVLPTRARPAGLLLDGQGRISVAAPQCCGGSAPFGEGLVMTRLLASGSPDTGFGAGGQFFLPTPGVQGNVEAAVLDPRGGAYISFERSTETVSTVGNLVKLRENGTVDGGFGQKGFSRIPLAGVDNLGVDGRGRLVAGGWNGSAAVTRLWRNGSVDRTFGGGVAIGLTASGPASGLGIQAGGKIVALAEPCCGTAKTFTLFRLAGRSAHSHCLGRKATIVGTRRADELTGTRRRDVIVALGGRDEVRGLGGSDLICGGPGRDKLLGGPGRDRVRP